ncbi:hypothetical protein, partial [Streptococcus sp. DD11]|uniref:hypothetical protein n=1 Tax=Streptococcus sp. DD11 TaxID=1777879 RepID=UPI0019CFC9B2
MVDWERAKVITLDSGYEDSKLQGMIENRDVAFLADGRHLWQEPALWLSEKQERQAYLPHSLFGESTDFSR